MFIKFKEAVTKQFERMKSHPLYRTEVTGDELWAMYLSSFPEGTNPIYRERSEHDCSCCKSFIRAVGNVVANIDGNLVSLWDTTEAKDEYAVVAEALSAFVKSKPIQNFFLSVEPAAGVDKNFEEMKDGSVKTWNHFYLQIPSEFVEPQNRPTRLSKSKAIHDVFKRSLEEISVTAIDEVLDLISSGSLYRGEEHQRTVEAFKELRTVYPTLETDCQRDLFCWRRDSIPIRNTVIGTLLVDLSEGKDLEGAVKSFEQKVAPDNYKRPKAVVTRGMIEKAEKWVTENGYLESLPRRYAVAEDVTINNVLFADRSAKKRMGVFEELKAEAPVNLDSHATEIPVEQFITDVLPKAVNVELLMEKRLQSNQVSLIAPVNADAPSMLKWNNNFSWVYAGEVADSMKQRVKAAGGNVEGIIRFSIQWNDEGDNNNDFDAHCIEPSGNLISYPKAGRECPSSGILDVDIVQPNGKVAVENITWSDEDRMQRGKYQFIVHNYTGRRSKRGFTAELEYEGKVYSYAYDKPLVGNEKVLIALCEYDGKSLKITGGMESSESQTSGQAEKVSMVMYSPNHWDEQGVGNRHYFFMLESVKKEGTARGFFNEFLQDSLNEHRKTFEMLGAKMQAPATEDQITGVGFSSTKRNHFNVRVDGKPYKVNV